MFPIIIVDDSKEDLALAERAFRQAHILNPIEVFDCGPACLAALKKWYQAEIEAQREPPLIIVDLAMPTMNGPQTIAEICEQFTAVPWIVMLSGQTDVKMVREGYQLGAKTFLSKPLQVSDVQQFFDSNQRSMRFVPKANGVELHWTQEAARFR
jgi:two-component system, response regulator